MSTDSDLYDYPDSLLPWAFETAYQRYEIVPKAVLNILHPVKKYHGLTFELPGTHLEKFWDHKVSLYKVIENTNPALTSSHLKVGFSGGIELPIEPLQSCGSRAGTANFWFREIGPMGFSGSGPRVFPSAIKLIFVPVDPVETPKIDTRVSPAVNLPAPVDLTPPHSFTSEIAPDVFE